MNKITNYQTVKAVANLAKPISDATHTITEISFLVLRIQTEKGIMGESYLLIFQYNPQAIAGAMKDVGEAIIGKEVNEMVKVFEEMNQANEYFGLEGINRWAQAAYNTAMWDTWCKTLDQPIWKVLGTYCTSVPIYGSGRWISYTSEELIEEVSDYKSRGFKAVKIKVGSPDWKEGLDRLKMVRDAVGNDIDIMMDANQGMDVPSALQYDRSGWGFQFNDEYLTEI